MASGMKEYYELVESTFGGNLYNKFMLAHGQEYPIGPNTYAGERGTPKECYSNATHAACWDDSLTYVEGKVVVYGIPIDHAWCVDKDGFVVDPTLRTGEDGSEPQDRIGGYFGVPFKTSYLRRAVLANNSYGLLDFFYASYTARKLFELGLEAGQQWLFDNPKPKRKRKRKAA